VRHEAEPLEPAVPDVGVHVDAVELDVRLGVELHARRLARRQLRPRVAVLPVEARARPDAAQVADLGRLRREVDDELAAGRVVHVHATEEAPDEAVVVRAQHVDAAVVVGLDHAQALERQARRPAAAIPRLSMVRIAEEALHRLRQGRKQ